MIPVPLRLLSMAAFLFAAAAPWAVSGSAAVIGKETRRTFGEYAQHSGISAIALRWRFGASGLLECPGRLASAQVVGDRWTILTSAHNILDDSGKFPWALDTCVFIVTGIDGRTVEHRVSTRNYRLGTRRPDRNRYQDWAVLTLETPVPVTIEPYRVDNPARRPIPRSGPVTVLAASHDNWRRRSKRVASIEDCRLRPIRLRINGRLGFLGFDCDTGKGASGAALLVRRRNGYRLIGLAVGERNRRRGAAYDSVRHFNAAIPVHRRMYEAIRAIGRSRRIDATSDAPPPLLPGLR